MSSVKQVSDICVYPFFSWSSTSIIISHIPVSSLVIKELRMCDTRNTLLSIIAILEDLLLQNIPKRKTKINVFFLMIYHKSITQTNHLFNFAGKDVANS